MAGGKERLTGELAIEVIGGLLTFHCKCQICSNVEQRSVSLDLLNEVEDELSSTTCLTLYREGSL